MVAYFEVEKLLGFPDFKRESYTIHHFCPVCECRFNYLQPHQYTLASAQVCRQPDCNGKRFRTEGASLVASQLAYYKKPVKIFEKLAASPELMGALKEERKRRDTLMETSFEWEDWFDGKCPAYTHEVSHSVIVVIVVHDTHIFIPFR
mgnify:CR=1 FL=1